MSGKPKTPQVSKVTIEAKAFHDLQQAEAKYRSTFENAAEGIFQSTPRGGEINARVAQLTALHKTLLDITAQRDLTKLLQAIVQRAARLLKGTSGGLYLCDAEKQECTCVVSYKTPRDYTGTVLRYGEGTAGKVAASGQPLQIDDYRAWEGHAKAFESEQPFRAVLAAPLLWHGGVTGVIDVLREQPFTQADLELLTMFASQAAIAIENARELEAERATRIQLEKEITARKQAEEALRESEARFRIALENSPIVVFNQDRELRYTWVYNPHPGFDPQTLLGKTDAELLPAEDTARLTEIKRRVLETGVTARDEVRTTIRGQAFFYDLTVEPLRDLSGNIIGVTCASLDISERKQAEKTLRESEERFRLLYEKAPLGYQSLDAAGCFIDVNQAWLDTLGYSREEVIGRWFGDFLAPHEVEAFKQRFPKFMATGKIQVEVETVRKDGAHAIIAIVGRIAYDEHGGFKQTHCILTDITERKRAEEALRESRERMAHLSRRLVDTQEEERRRIARELHDEVGQSLTALTISLDSVSQLALDGVMQSKIAEIQALTKNLIAEVNALSVELRPRVLDDLGLIPGLISLFSRFSTQTGVEIDFKHTGIKRKRVTPEIEISAYRIIQEALTNVVRHAVVKMASVRLQVEADMMWIQVQDEGKGFNLQQAMKAEDSMGLLSMTERAEQVGGRLEVQTAPGEGTLITCRLPLGGSHVDKEGV
ncbi:MAG: PAS domain S-box protein [Anaerolineales bacterium]|nr:PAS domain S-box protein [Anaerolineales bacterium]